MPAASSRRGARRRHGLCARRRDARGPFARRLGPRALALYRRLEADLIVAEVNQGGEMVRAVLHEVDATVPVKTVHATRGKYVRAEPVAVMYAQGRVKHAGPPLAELEDDLCDFGPGGLSTGRSPDRLDALVWAVTELMGPAAVPRIRSF